MNDEERRHAAAWRCSLGLNQQHVSVSQPSQQLYKALPRISPLFSLTTLKNTESKKYVENLRWTLCFGLVFRKYISLFSWDILPSPKSFILRLEIQNSLFIDVMSPPKRTMHMYLGAQALEDMHRPCYSDLGLNRFFALISRYRNQLRLRDHAQASVLGTSGSKVYTNISLTPPLSLSLRLIKMRY
jgi:hypothetical protein